MFVSLPAGFGISLSYIMLPLCFDARRGVKKKSMILVVSPLKALMMDQVSAIRRLVLSAVCVTDKECATNSEVTEGLQKGEYQTVFINPEYCS